MPEKCAAAVDLRVPLFLERCDDSYKGFGPLVYSVHINLEGIQVIR